MNPLFPVINDDLWNWGQVQFFKTEFLFVCFAAVVLKSRHVVLLAVSLSGL